MLKFEEKTHSQTEEKLITYKITDPLEKDEYINLNNQMKAKGCYYSKFLKAFVCKTEIDTTTIDIKKKSKPSEKANPEYHKILSRYITVEDYKEFLKKYAQENYRKTRAYRDDAKEYEKSLLDSVDRQMKYDYYEEIPYIREAILHKSLNLPKDEFDCNGEKYKYLAIWEKLPTIKDLHLTNEAYTAMWGYDQTNVDIAYRLNKKVWGLDIFRDNSRNFCLVRMKDGRFHDGVRYFSRDHNPQETFKQDASQTGHYR